MKISEIFEGTLGILIIIVAAFGVFGLNDFMSKEALPVSRVDYQIWKSSINA